MRARRRERVSGDQSSADRPGGGHGNSGGGGGGNSGSGGGGGKGRNRKRRNRKRKNPKGPRHHEAGFWGDKSRLPEPTQDVRITDDPAAVARSLGAPPLPGHEKIAEHYFTVVYERAVQTAGALAAAGGLIDPEVLAQEFEGHQ